MDRTEGKTRIAVLVSGRGTNLEAILQACQTGVIDGTVAAVLSNRPGCAALEVGRQWAVPLVRAFPVGDYADRRARDRDMASVLRAAAVDLVVTAGYDRVLDEDFVAAFPGRILNVHPSLLPAFAGTMQAVRDAFLADVRNIRDELVVMAVAVRGAYPPVGELGLQVVALEGIEGSRG